MDRTSIARLACAATAALSTFFALDVAAQAPTPTGDLKPSASCALSADAQASWRAFRDKGEYPFHAQGIAVRPEKDGSKTIIVAEPPPEITEDQLKNAGLPFVSFTATCILDHSVGVDGWTKDFVATLPSSTSEAEVAGLVSSVHQVLFHTSYKAYTLEKPTPGKTKVAARIRPEELDDWLIKKAQPLLPLGGGTETSAQKLLEAKSSGVFVTKDPGLVVWAMKRPADISNAAEEARKFAVDSDIVVGAMRSSKAVLIIGREREADVSQVAPLRFESLRLLASTKGEVTQSYERQYVLAGLSDPVTHKAWAPIYLSEDLLDTEFGSELNIADQILKGWSNAGKTKYVGFEYPTKPVFPQPLSTQLGVDALIYNWNTRGFGVYHSDGDRETLAFRSTAAMPVIYDPKASPTLSLVAPPTTEELTAHTHFHDANDPHLVRVAQYSALFQIFRTFDVTAKASSIAAPAKPVDELMVDETSKALDAVRVATGPTLDSAARDIVRDLSLWAIPGQEKVIRDAFAKKTLPPKLEPLVAEWRSKIVRLQEHLQKQAAQGKLAEYGKQVGSRHGVPASAVPKGLTDEDIGFILREFAGKKPIERVQGARATSHSRWIHTPSVVVSWNEGQLADAVGGHSVPPYVFQPKGAAKVANANVMTVDAATLAKLRPELPVGPPRTVAATLGVPSPAAADGSRGFRGRVTKSGWELLPLSKDSGNQIAMAEKLGAHAHVERVGGQYSIVVSGPPRRQFVAFTQVDTAEILAREVGGDVVIDVHGLPSAEASNLLRSMALRAGPGSRLPLAVDAGANGPAVKALLGFAPKGIDNPLVVFAPKDPLLKVSVGGKPWMEIRFDFKSSKPAEKALTEKVLTETVEAAIKKSGNAADTATVLRNVADSLRSVLKPGDGYQMRLDQMTDVTIVERTRRHDVGRTRSLPV